MRFNGIHNITSCSLQWGMVSGMQYKYDTLVIFTSIWNWMLLANEYNPFTTGHIVSSALQRNKSRMGGFLFENRPCTSHGDL